MNADNSNDDSNSNMEETAILKVATMNILAPCYNKVDGIFESDNPNDYMERHRKICVKLLETDADIIFLQEFWSASTALRNLYINELCQPEINELNKGLQDGTSQESDTVCIQQGIKGLRYTMRELRRTAHWRTRDDSIVTFVKSDRIVIQDAKNILFHDAGDRVALMLLLGLRSGRESSVPLQQFICINTHLLFPHNEYSTKIRMREITKILGFVESYKQNDLCQGICDRADVRLPIIIAGDFNGGPRGSVYKFIKSQNYRCAAEDVLVRRWVTHKSHLGHDVAVDHVFYLNPSEQVAEKLPPLPDWTNLVFQEVMQSLVEKFGGATSMRDIFATFDRDSTETITLADFEDALKKLGFEGEGSPALTREELDVLMQSADVDKNGMIDYQEFCDRFWIAANRETERMFAKSESGSESAFSDGLSFARSKWLTNKTPLPSAPVSSSNDRGNCSRIIEVVIDEDGEEEGEIDQGSDDELPLQDYTQQQIGMEMEVDSGSESTTGTGRYDVNADLYTQPLGDMRVLNVSLWPRELEQGCWPADFKLSDHGLVECVFQVALTPRPLIAKK
eukprot:gene31598-41028_t